MCTALLSVSQLAWPTNWDELYGRSAPLLLEIGFGGGHFLVDWAKRRPEANLLGLEISLPSLRRGAKKIQQARLTNVRLAQGNAWLLLQAACAPGSISEIQINFPDPWRKERHYHRRLISDEFLHLAATRLVPGGLLNIATDHADYAQWITERLERTPFFDNCQPTTFVTKDNERLRTKYELKAIAEGRICHYYKFQRKDQPLSNPFPALEETPMPHVIMKSPLTLAEIGRQFQPQQHSSAAAHVNLLEAYQSFYDQKLLVETYVKEGPLAQRVGLSISQRETGDLIVGLHEVGFPRPTRGIQFAIARLARWLTSLHPDTQITANNLGDVLDDLA